MASASDHNFAAVPSEADVPVADVAKLTGCLLDCSLNPSNLLFPFKDCVWADDKEGTSSTSSCLIKKSCFLACFDTEEKPAVYENRYNPKRTSFTVDAALSPTTVSQITFEVQSEWNVDGAVYAQPLYAPHVRVAKGTYKNLVIIATEFNSVFAFDADTKERVWKINLTIGRVVNSTDIPVVSSRPGGPCNDIAPYYGITSTPVIDPVTGTVYAMSHSIEGATIETATYRLNALDLATGKHKSGSPTSPVAASRGFPTAPFPANATTFVAIKQHQRPGLALAEGQVYAAFGSHCDRPPYFPWLFAFDAKTLAINSFWTSPILVSRFNQTNPNFGPVEGGGPTIWMGGTAPTIFRNHLYVVTGRGPVDPPNQGYGNAVLKFPLDLSSVDDHFIPANGIYLDNVDLDLGSSGAVIVKDNYIMTGGKQGPLYLLEADNLGGYQPNANNSNAFQVINPVALTSNNPTGETIYSGPAYWAGNDGQVFTRGRRTNQALYRYPWDKNTGKLASTPAATASVAVGVFRNRASNPVVQATSEDATEAILWEIDEQSSLFAWDAMSLKLIYQSNNTGVCGGTPSSSGGVVKFQLPTVVAGKVFLGCGNKVLVYGLKD